MQRGKNLVGILLLFTLFIRVGFGEILNVYQITINNTNTYNLTDFQVKISLNSSSINWSDVNTDGSNIRFYSDQDLTNKIPYWIENFNYTSQQATIWIKTNLSVGDNYVYLVLTNDTVSESNGDSVFEFFDHYLGNSLNKSKWVYYPEVSNTIGTVVVKNSIASLYTMKIGTRFRYKTLKAFNVPFIVEQYIETQGGNDGIILDIYNNTNSLNFHFGWAYPGYYGGTGVVYRDATGVHPLYKFPLNTNKFVKIIYIFYKNGSFKTITEYENFSGRISIQNDSKYLAIGDGYGAYGPGYAMRDYIFVRKYADKEPTVINITRYVSSTFLNYSVSQNAILAELYSETSGNVSYILEIQGSVFDAGTIELNAGNNLVRIPLNDVTFCGVQSVTLKIGNQTITKEIDFGPCGVTASGGGAYEAPENPLYILIVLIFGVIYITIRNKK